MLKCELRIISGARAGHRDVLDKSYIGLGRHPLSDVKFDAEKDLDASTRHAAIVKNGDSYVLKDLGSTNGTYVNGEKLEAERTLHDGDVLKFGVHGPEVSFHILRDEQEVMMEAVHVKTTPPIKTPPPTFSNVGESEPSREMPPPTSFGGETPGTRPRPLPPGAPDLRSKPKPAPKPAAASAAPPAPPSKTSVLRAEISHQKSKGRALAITIGVVVIGALAVVVWQARKSQAIVATVEHTRDSVIAVLDTLRHLQHSTDSMALALQAQMAAEQDPARRQVIRNRVDSVTARSRAIVQAQTVNYSSIEDQNKRAIAIIVVRFPDTTQMWEGTAFSVNAQGLMLTNRHLVVNNAGERAKDIAIRFNGSTDVLPARLVSTSPDADLATVQLESQGPFPAVSGLGGTAAAPGMPIALIGFPGGCGSCARPNAKLVTGSVTTASDSLLELDAFSGTGASGSPIFDRDGKVIGVLFGGRGGASSNEIVGLPIARARALLGSH